MRLGCGWLVVVVVACGLVTACGSGSNGNSGPEAGAGDSDSAADSPGEGGSGEAGPGPNEGGTGDGGSDSGTHPPYQGFVLLYSDATPFYSLTVSFYPYGSSSCPMALGSCCYYPPASASGPSPTTGTISVVDGTSAIVTIQETDAGYSYNNVAAWMPGDTLAFSSVGDVVHAFNGSVKAPQPLLGVSPPPAATPTMIPISSNLVIGWSAGSSSTLVAVELSSMKNGMSDGTIMCTFTDTGSGSVPASALAHLTAGDTGSLYVFRLSRSTATCNNTDVTVEVGSVVGQSVAFQ